MRYSLRRALSYKPNDPLLADTALAWFLMEEGGVIAVSRPGVSNSALVLGGSKFIPLISIAGSVQEAVGIPTGCCLCFESVTAIDFPSKASTSVVLELAVTNREWVPAVSLRPCDQNAF